jgi:hypothetical protein
MLHRGDDTAGADLDAAATRERAGPVGTPTREHTINGAKASVAGLLPVQGWTGTATVLSGNDDGPLVSLERKDGG